MLQNALVSRLRDWIGDRCKQIRFAQTEAYIQTEDETDLPSTSKPTWQGEPPKNIRKGAKVFYMRLNWRLVDNSQKYRYPLKILVLLRYID